MRALRLVWSVMQTMPSAGLRAVTQWASRSGQQNHTCLHSGSRSRSSSEEATECEDETDEATDDEATAEAEAGEEEQANEVMSIDTNAANDDVLIRAEGRAGRITLNRPKSLNALSHAMSLAIEAAMDHVDAPTARISAEARACDSLGSLLPGRNVTLG